MDESCTCAADLPGTESDAHQQTHICQSMGCARCHEGRTREPYTASHERWGAHLVCRAGGCKRSMGGDQPGPGGGIPGLSLPGRSRGGEEMGAGPGEDPKMKVESCHAEDGSHQLATGYDYRRGADVVKLTFSFFLAESLTFRRSQARDQTRATATTMPDP